MQHLSSNIEGMSLAEINVLREEQRFDRGLLTFVIGLQYGSEAKGSIVNYLSPGIDLAVRTGAANAGHTLYYEGEAHVMRQLPAAWTNRHAKLAIGVGAIISPNILLSEIKSVEEKISIKDRLAIDPNAHVITEEQIVRESLTDLAERIGSTSVRSSEGIGVAIADKVLRKASCVQAKHVDSFKPYLTDTAELVNDTLDIGMPVLIEGTQGFGLSLDHGSFPYVTSRDTIVPALAASVGVSPHHYQTQVIGVARTYPIRVAGNSGPFAAGSKELTWDEVARRAGIPIGLEERTTVTKLLRRVANFSIEQYVRACRINRPTEIALTFADYLDWSIHDTHELSPPVYDFIDNIEKAAGIPVTMVNTGPHATIDFDRYRSSMLRRMD